MQMFGQPRSLSTQVVDGASFFDTSRNLAAYQIALRFPTSSFWFGDMSRTPVCPKDQPSRQCTNSNIDLQLMLKILAAGDSF